MLFDLVLPPHRAGIWNSFMLQKSFKLPESKYMLRCGHTSIHLYCQSLRYVLASIHVISFLCDLVIFSIQSLRFLSNITDLVSVIQQENKLKISKNKIESFQWTLYVVELHKWCILPNHWIIQSHVNYLQFWKHVLYFYPWIMHFHCVALLICFIIIILSSMNSVMCASMFKSLVWLMNAPESVTVYLQLMIL